MVNKTLMCAVVLLFAGEAWGQQAYSEGSENNWPRWRGPLATGVAPHGDPPVEWGEDTNVKWKVALPGRGSGSPIVWEDRIFLLAAIKTERTAEPEDRTATKSTSDYHLIAQNQQRGEREEAREQGNPRDRGVGRGRGGFGGGRRGRNGDVPSNIHQFIVLCLDRQTGESVWQQTAAEQVPHEGHHRTSTFASSSPVTDGENLYVSFGSRGIYSYDIDGNFRWKRDLGQMQTRNSFGEAASPALYGDTLVVNWDHEGDSFIVALDAETGKTRWQKSRREPTTWATPLIVEHDGRVQVITNGTNRVRSYDLKTGAIVWECGGQAQNPIPTPLVHGDLVFCTTGHRGSALFAIPMDSRGDITDSDQVAWSVSRDTPYVPSPIIVDGLLYYTKSNNAILTCVNAETGEIQYATERLPEVDMIYSSPVSADGRIYISGRNGATVVLKAGPTFEVLTINKLDEPIDATPAIVDNEMILRTEGHLYSLVEQ